MTGIVVSVKPPTDAGRLHPRYDEESGILAVESRIERDWSFGVDVDGTLVFDLDERRILANFDLHVPRGRWKRGIYEHKSIIAPAGDIEFTQESIEQRSFHLPLKLISDQSAGCLHIKIGAVESNRAVTLSDSCIALLANHELVGFLIADIR